MVNFKRLFFTLGAAVALPFACIVAVWCWEKWEYNLPSDQQVVEHFSAHRADYIRFAELVQKEPSPHSIDVEGKLRFDGDKSQFVQVYKELMRRTGTTYVLVREDNSIEFERWGFGCAICSDSYKGVRFVPRSQGVTSKAGWEQTLVSSLEDLSLPQQNGRVEDGLYVVPMEPEWFIYRLEIQ